MRVAGAHFPGLIAVPVRSLFLLALAITGMVGLAVLSLQQLPSLGADFEPFDSGAGVVVTSVWPKTAAEGRLQRGDLVTAVRGEGGSLVGLSGVRPDLEPHGLSTFAALRSYLARQGRVFAALDRETVTLITSRGEITLRPREHRPLNTIPASFWLFHLFGGLALMLGGAVWLARRERMDTALLALSGLGFFLATWFNSIYLARELALPSGVFDLLLRGNHLALTVMIGAILLLFVHYPRGASARWPSYLVVLTLTVYQLNENMQWLDWPLHSFYLPLILMYGLALALAWRQWRLSAWNPVDRASLKWVFLAILMTMGTCMVVYFLPPILGAEALLPQVAMVGFAAVMYLGLALGVIRYRLFQLEHWWFELWFWFFAGLMLVLVDLGLIWLMQLDQFQALGLAVILVGWAYFPIRQQVWRRLTRRRQDNLIELLPDVVNAMLEASGRQEMESRWSGLLRRAFNPLTLAFSTDDLHRSELASDGESLHVPGLFGGRWMLKYARKGQRLFTLTDIGEANSLWLVARQVGDVRSAREEGAEMERRRIVRDLHDDVGNRLLSLVRFSETPRQEQLARSTLKALRETMAAFDPGREIRLDQLLIERRDEVRERYAEQAEIVRWSWPAPVDMPLLSPRQAINIRRILDEALGNAVNHADPTFVDVRCRFNGGSVSVSIENDGAPAIAAEEETSLRGRGMKNMQTRAREIGATIQFTHEGDRYRVLLEWAPFQDRAWA